MSGTRWGALARSQVGASHTLRSIECQDHSAAAVARSTADWVSERSEAGDWTYLVVADGHGSALHFRSQKGAELAVEALERAFRAVQRSLLGNAAEAATTAGDGGPPPADPLQLGHWREWAPRFVVSEWRSLVYDDLLSHPPGDPEAEPGLARLLDDIETRSGGAAADLMRNQMEAFGALAESAAGDGRPSPLPLPDDPAWDRTRLGSWHAPAYGTTLLGVMIGPEALYWFRIGDGAMVQIVDDEPRDLVPAPAEALANETPSLCDELAVKYVDVNAVPLVPGHVPSALVLSTDGVPNSYDTPEGFLTFCGELAHRAHTEPAVVADRMPDWLDELSRRGSGDDVTLALAWRID